MSLLQKHIYAHLPVIAQNWAISAYGYQWHKRRFGGIFEQELRGFKEREGYTAQQWRDYQTIQLRNLLVHAFETVPFYRKKYSQLGFNLTDFEKFELEDLNKLPYLEKEDLRRFGNNDLVSAKRENGGQFFSSSGSTGTPTQILFSQLFHQRWSAAFEARIRHWAGVNRFMPRGMIGGRRIIQEAISPPPYYRYNFVEKQTYFSAYHFSPETAMGYLQGMIQNKVKYMTGYAMSNYFLANILDELQIEAPRLEAVITSSEKLTTAMRDKFFKVYGCKTFDSYSGLEAFGLISESQEGELLVSPDVGIMEILDEQGKQASPGEVGEVVSTGLLNFDQPLIRYRIGDMVTVATEQRTISGKEMTVISEINGRIEDKILGADGRQIVRFHGLYINIPGLIAAQIVQEAIGVFSFNLVVDPTYNCKSEVIITNRLSSQLGAVQVIFCYLKEIPKNANGKFQAVISKLSHL